MAKKVYADLIRKIDAAIAAAPSGGNIILYLRQAKHHAEMAQEDINILRRLK